MKKIQKVKTQTSEANLRNLKFLNLSRGVQTDLFLSILIYGTLKLEFVYESYDYFTNGLQIRGQNGLEVGKIYGDG